MENVKKKAQELRKKKQWKVLERHENVRDKMKVTMEMKKKVEGLVKKWLLSFEKNLNKIVNLDQKTCKNKTMKGKLENDSITSSLYIINKSNLSKVRQSKPCNNSRLRSWLCCCKDSKVVCFKWTVLDFVSEIVLNLFVLFTRKLYRKILFNFAGEIL